MELLYIMIQRFFGNRIKRPTHCEVMPDESKLAHFSQSKKEDFIAINRNTTHNVLFTSHELATFYLKVKLHKHILNRFSFDCMDKLKLLTRLYL